MGDEIVCLKCGWTGTTDELVDDFGDTADTATSDDPDDVCFCPNCGSMSVADAGDEDV